MCCTRKGATVIAAPLDAAEMVRLDSLRECLPVVGMGSALAAFTPPISPSAPSGGSVGASIDMLDDWAWYRGNTLAEVGNLVRGGVRPCELGVDAMTGL